MFKGLVEITKYTSFEFVEEKYASVVNLINNNFKQDKFGLITYCPSNFTLSLVYNTLPVNNNEEVIKDIFEICKAYPSLFKCSYDELLNHPQIVMFLENKYYIDTSELYHYTESQQRVLSNYFYEALSEVEYKPFSNF